MINEADKEQLKFIQLKIANEIKRVCEKNNIRFFLDAGSMLGAVRHKGFIPWDDDLDIGMLKEDYDKFLRIAPNELGEEFFLDNKIYDDEYALVFSKVRLKNTKFIEKINSKKSKHNEIFVDVFSYIDVPNNKLIRSLFFTKLRFFSQIFMVSSGFEFWKNNSMYSFLKYLPIRFLAKIINRDNLYKKIDFLSSSVVNSNYVALHDGNSYEKYLFEKEYFKNLVNVKFENEIFMIPKEFDKVLKKEYGDDYMQIPPIEKRYNHEIQELKFK